MVRSSFARVLPALATRAHSSSARAVRAREEEAASTFRLELVQEAMVGTSTWRLVPRRLPTALEVPSACSQEHRAPMRLGRVERSGSVLVKPLERILLRAVEASPLKVVPPEVALVEMP